MVQLEDDALVCDHVKRAILAWDDTKPTTVTEKKEDVFVDYHKFIAKKWLFMAACVLIVIVVSGVALTIGDVKIGFWESYATLWYHFTGVVNPTFDYIITELRLPRIIVGIIAGAGLAIAGAAMQSILNNPLADPYTTGVSSGAGFGATVAMTLGVSIGSGSYTIVVNAFVFALIPVAVILSVAKLKNASPTVMVMAGIAVMYIFNAMTTVLMLWADPTDMAAVYQWQVGSLSSSDWADIPIMAVVTGIGGIVIMSLSKKLNVLATGDESAKAMGVDADNLRIICMIVIALVTASIVSFTGLIGFVGLVAPHVVRLFIGSDNRYLIPASALFGSALMVTADLVGRTIIAPTVLQVGVITAFLGGPLFLWLIIRKKDEVWG